MAKSKLTTVQRFELKYEVVTETGCWIWTAATYKSSGGDLYGNFQIDGALDGAHRAAWRLFVGPIPEGMHVLHRCDVSLCVNPAHLFLGTNQDNVDDKMRKGRFKPMIGEKHGMAIFTEADVLDIRARYARGERQVDIAHAYGVERFPIYQIVHRRLWKHI